MSGTALSARPPAGAALPHAEAEAPEAALMPLAVAIATRALGPLPIVALTASRRREGTSTVVAMLARALQGGLGRSVAVIDANLAAPSLAERNGVDPAPGLAEVLRGAVPLRQALHVAASGQLAVLPAGGAGAAAQGALFATGGIAGLCGQVRQEGFEFCLIDCPAVLSSPEAAMVAAQAGTALLVLRAESTRQDAMREAVAILQGGGAPLAGTVLNRYRRHLPAFLDQLL